MKLIQQILIAFWSIFITSCNNTDNAKPAITINYPAAYVVNGTSSTLSVINLNTNEVADLIQLTDDLSGVSNNGRGRFLQYPHHIYLNPAKNQIAIAAPGMDLSEGHGTAEVLAHSGTAKVAVIDAIKGVNIKLIDVPDMNHNAIYSPDGKEIWTSQMDEKGKVLVYDANTYALKNTINVGKEPAEVTFSNDGLTAFVANGMDNSVSAINPITKTVIATISVGQNPVGAWTGSDNRMYVDNEDGQTVSVIDVKTLKVVETITLGFMPGYAAFNGEMKELWVTDPMAGKLHWWKQDANGKFAKGGSVATANGAHAIAFKDMTAYITNQEAASVSVVDVMKHEKIKDIKVGEKPNGIVIRL
jgi:YVTN family beta-propeller protein